MTGEHHKTPLRRARGLAAAARSHDDEAGGRRRRDAHESALGSYLRELARDKRMPQEQEIELAQAIDDGYREALAAALRVATTSPWPVEWARALGEGTLEPGALSDLAGNVARPREATAIVVAKVEDLVALEQRYPDLARRLVERRPGARAAAAAYRRERAALIRSLSPRRRYLADLVTPTRELLSRFARADELLAAGRHSDDRQRRRSLASIAAVKRELGCGRRELGRAHSHMRRAFDSIDGAKTALVRANLRLVFLVARRYANRGLAMADLIQEGNIGLMRAVEKFEHRWGTRLSTYAGWWIRQAIQKAVDNHGSAVRLPSHVGNELRLAARTRARLANGLGREPEIEEVARALGRSAERVARTLEGTPRAVSLEHPLGRDDDLRLGDMLFDDTSLGPAEVLWLREVRSEVEGLVSALPARDQRIITMRFGLGCRPRTLQEIGDCLGLTRERVRQIEARTLAQLRSQARQQRKARLVRR